MGGYNLWTSDSNPDHYDSNVFLILLLHIMKDPKFRIREGWDIKITYDTSWGRRGKYQYNIPLTDSEAPKPLHSTRQSGHQMHHRHSKSIHLHCKPRKPLSNVAHLNIAEFQIFGENCTRQFLTSEHNKFTLLHPKNRRCYHSIYAQDIVILPRITYSSMMIGGREIHDALVACLLYPNWTGRRLLIIWKE